MVNRPLRMWRGCIDMPEGEDGVCDVGIVDVGAMDGVEACDFVFEELRAGAFREEGDERIGVIFAVPFHSGQVAWAVIDEVIAAWAS